MLQLFRTGVFKTEYLAALGIDTGHDVLDGAVLSSGVLGLKNQQQRKAVGRVEKLLLIAQFLHVLCQQLLILLLRLVHGFHDRRPFFEVDLVSFPHAKIL